MRESMHAEHRQPSTRRIRRRVARSRLVGRVLALALLLHAVPTLPAWLARDGEQPGARLVRLCTTQGLRMVRVPAGVIQTATDSAENDGPAPACVLCLLAKCTGCGSMPASAETVRFGPVACAMQRHARDDEACSTIGAARRLPPSRGPPVLV